MSLLARIGGELGLEPARLERLSAPHVPVPLASRLATSELAWSSVAAVCAAIAPPGTVPETPDPARIAAAYQSDRHLLIDGVAPPVWAPLSGFWQASDGWVRMHGNYPHHAAALRAGLGLDDDADADAVRDAVRDAVAALPVDRIVADVTAAGGLAVAVLPEDPSADAALRAGPLVDVRRTADSAPTPAAGTIGLSGIRVLDLTRVIAGPVAGRTLALLGADVLRIDPPHLPEFEWQHLDTGHGKRSAVLDVRSERMSALFERADVVLLGYRPAALERMGLEPNELLARYPGLVVAQLSGWGAEHPDRRGFDSLVQAESGIALIESPDGRRPGALPAQALDHSAGYLLAVATIASLRRRRSDGGGYLIRTSLRRVAAELLGMRRGESSAPGTAVDAPTEDFEVDGRRVTTARSAIPGHEYAAPRPWGRDQPVW